MKRTMPPRSSVTFDWTMGLFSVLIMAGVFQDGWAHNHGLVDQSFMTPWHAILYGTMALAGVVLLVTGIRNLRAGYSFQCGLRFGYWTSAAGVILFIAGGVFDMFWHTLFGIEVNIQGLISPSHLTLALGGGLVFAGVLRSIASQYGPATGGWRRVGPAVCAALATLMLLGFFTQYAQPYADDTLFQIIGPVPPTGGGALYSVGSDGSRETRVAIQAGQDIFGAAPSPDGALVAYRQQTAGDASLPSDIYVAKADGTHAVRISHSGRHDTEPAWSPDGSRIAFISMPAGSSGNFKLQTMRPDGSDLRTIVDGVTTIQDPSWSPDSRSIALSSRNGITAEIAVVPAAGGALQWLKSTEGGSAPAWSSSNQIAFQTSGGDIAVANPAASSPRVVATNASAPSWSSDGKRLAYLAADNGETQVFVSDLRGHARDVSQLSGLDAARPAWSRSAIYFSATGHPRAAQTGIGRAYGIDAAIISSVILTGIVLLIVRRWRAPAGAITALVGISVTALSTQSDLYFAIPGALVIAIATDVAIASLRDRARSGVAFYTIGFGLPCLLFVAYLVSLNVHLGGLGWPPNMLLGSPIIAGFAGLLVSFCYAPPLRAGEPSAQDRAEPAYSSVRAEWETPVTT